MQLTVANVATISRLYRSIKTEGWLAQRSQAECWTYTKATAQSLARLGQHGLAADVRLPKAKVEQMLWTIFKAAKAAHAAAKAAAAKAAAEAEVLSEYDALRLAEHVAQLDNDVALFV